MRSLVLFAVLFPGFAQAGFIDFESSQTFTTAQVSGCQVVRWGADNGAVSSYECGASAGSGALSSGATGPAGSFGIGATFQSVDTTDTTFEIVARSYWAGNWFEGNFQDSAMWNGVFSLTSDAHLTASGFGPQFGTQGAGSLMVRNLSSGELVTSRNLPPDASPDSSVFLASGSKYSVMWLGTEFAYNYVTGGSADAGTPGFGGLVIEAVPEPGTFVLFGAGLFGLFLATRRKVTAAATSPSLQPAH